MEVFGRVDEVFWDILALVVWSLDSLPVWFCSTRSQLLFQSPPCRHWAVFGPPLRVV